MGLRNLLRRKNRLEEKGLVVPQLGDAQGDAMQPVHQITVSQESLQMLLGGRDAMLQQRQQLTQEIARIDAAVAKQEGGILLLQQLLKGQQKQEAQAEKEVPKPVAEANGSPGADQVGEAQL